MYTLQEFFSFDHFLHKELIEECVYPWHILERLKKYLDAFQGVPIQKEQFPGVFFQNPEKIFVGGNVSIEPGAYIQGPVFLGKNSTVRHAAYIRPYVIVDENAVVGHASEIKHAILLYSAHAAHFNYVGDTIVGASVNLGSGAICANLRLDRKEVFVQGIETKLKKLGAIIGDGAEIGCNTVLNPGTLIGKKALIAPGKTITGVVSEGTIFR